MASTNPPKWGVPVVDPTANVAPAVHLYNPTVSASRVLSKYDVDQIVNAAHASVPIVLTLQTDSLGGFSQRDTIGLLQGGSAAVSVAAGPGVTLSGTAPTMGLGLVLGVIRTGSDAWAYL